MSNYMVTIAREEDLAGHRRSYHYEYDARAAKRTVRTVYSISSGADGVKSFCRQIRRAYISTNAQFFGVLGEISGRLAPYAFGNITDLNSIEIIKYGIYFNMVATTTAPANLPSQMSSSNRFLLICVYAGYDRCQIVINRSSNAPCLRYGTGETLGAISWSEWKEL